MAGGEARAAYGAADEVQGSGKDWREGGSSQPRRPRLHWSDIVGAVQSIVERVRKERDGWVKR
jgi:hypothetical protein